MKVTNSIYQSPPINHNSDHLWAAGALLVGASATILLARKMFSGIRRVVYDADDIIPRFNQIAQEESNRELAQFVKTFTAGSACLIGLGVYQVWEYTSKT